VRPVADVRDGVNRLSNDALKELTTSIETEMRRLDLWATVSPPLGATRSDTPFCADALECEQWLQWVFLPRLAEVRSGSLRPRFRSNVAAYCEACFSMRGIRAETLLALTRRCDEILGEMVSLNASDDTDSG